MPASSATQAIADVARKIHVVRGQRVLLDSDLAAVYGVTTKAFNQAVRRNLDRFPADFLVPLTNHDVASLRSQIVTSNVQRQGRGGRRHPPMAFTEHGAVMAATILNSPRAVQINVVTAKMWRFSRPCRKVLQRSDFSAT